MTLTTCCDSQARAEIAETDARNSQKKFERQKKVYEEQLRKMREQNPAAVAAKHVQALTLTRS